MGCHPCSPAPASRGAWGWLPLPPPVPPRFAGGWERGPGRVEAVQPRPGWDGRSLGGSGSRQQGGLGGEQGTHSKGQEEGGSITCPHRLLPWPWRTPGRAWLSVLSPPSPPPPNLHTYIGVLGGPQPGWGGMLRDWTAQSHAYRLSLEMGRGKALQAALCLAQQLADCLRQGGSC